MLVDKSRLYYVEAPFKGTGRAVYLAGVCSRDSYSQAYRDIFTASCRISCPSCPFKMSIDEV